MTTCAIIQARTGSTRLPRKVLQDIGGRTMLARVVERARAARMVDEVIVATTVLPEDDAIVAACVALDVRVSRGSELDVLDRYHQAALAARADTVVRITSDCPLLDPALVDELVGRFEAERPDYASNSLDHRYPRGLDAECMTQAALGHAWRAATRPYERVHVTPYLYQNPHLFRLLSVSPPGDHGHHRWTVDTPADLALVRAVWERLGRSDFGWRDVLAVVDGDATIRALNAHVQQKALEEG